MEKKPSRFNYNVYIDYTCSLRVGYIECLIKGGIYKNGKWETINLLVNLKVSSGHGIFCQFAPVQSKILNICFKMDFVPPSVCK